MPTGLVGVYEEAIPLASQVTERKKFLEFFGVWALLKKEVSAEFVVSLLDGWKEAEVLAHIGRYSKWFNSPVSGLYTLYHERFRTFVLQKIAEGDILSVNGRIIKLCKGKLILKQGDEYERYVLEHLSSHVLLAAMRSKEAGEELKKLAYDSTLWNRQIKVSNRFDWSKKMLDEMFLWALKYDESQILECSLCKVDLHYIEQNDAPQIIAMVANGEVQLALERIESFGGVDVESVARKFILYMLCFSELTIESRSDTNLNRSSIERMINHLNEHIPNEGSMLDWGSFFPSYLIFRLATEIARLELDYMFLFQRTSNFEKSWISSCGPYTDLEFSVMLNIINFGNDEYNLIEVVSIEMARQNKLESAFLCISRIKSETIRFKAYLNISTELFNAESSEELTVALSKALNILKTMAAGVSKCRYMAEMATMLAKIGQIENSTVLMEEALSGARALEDQSMKSKALEIISHNLLQLGFLDQALGCVQDISNLARRSEMLAVISTALIAKGNMERGASLIEDAKNNALGIENQLRRDSALSAISIELVRQDKLEEAYSCSSLIRSGASLRAIESIALEMVKNRRVEDALNCIARFYRERDGEDVFESIASELAKQGLFDKALHLARGINDMSLKCRALKQIAVNLAERKRTNEFTLIMKESLACAKVMYELREISAELAKFGQFESSLLVLRGALSSERGIVDEGQRVMVIKEISILLAMQGKLREALQCARGMKNKDDIIKVNLAIWQELNKEGKQEDAHLFSNYLNIDEGKTHLLIEFCKEMLEQGKLDEAMDIAVVIDDDFEKCSLIRLIAKEYCAKENLQRALVCIGDIGQENLRSGVFCDIAGELYAKGEIEKSQFYLKEALTIARRIDNVVVSARAIKNISSEMYKQGLIKDAAEVINEALTRLEKIVDYPGRISAISSILKEMTTQDLLDEALAFVRKRDTSYDKTKLLCEISNHLNTLGLVEGASMVISEVIQSFLEKPPVARSYFRLLKEVYRELIKQNRIEDALRFARSTGDESLFLIELVSTLANEGQFELAINFINRVSSEEDKNEVMSIVSIKMAEFGKPDDSLTYANMINSDHHRDNSFEVITKTYATNNHWAKAISTGMRITQIAKRHELWKSLANDMIQNNGWQSALKITFSLESKEFQQFYMNGWACAVNPKYVSHFCFQEALQHVIDDSGSLEILLQKYASREVALGKPAKELTARLNRTLNIQWLLDITAQFPGAEAATARTSTNLVVWLHEITDEDDREQIELWAKQVAKGKITEEEFRGKIMGIN